MTVLSTMKPAFKKLILLSVLILFVVFLWIYDVKTCKHHEGSVLKENLIAATCLERGSCDEVSVCSLCDKRYKTVTVNIPITHKTVNGACTVCGEIASDAGLKFSRLSNGYSLSGIGTCTETHVTVSTYNNGAVLEIGSKAFRNCTQLECVTIGNNVKSISFDAFVGCENLEKIEVARYNNEYISVDGNLYSKDGKTLLLYAKGKKEESVTIPDGVTAIGDYAFYGCSELTSVVIPSSVTSIGSNAFANCVKLAGVELPNGVTDIGWGAFSSTAITSIELSGSIQNIEGAFINCEKLTSVTLGEGITNIGEGTFYNCTALKSISIPESVKSIGKKAFKNTGYYRSEGNWENGALYLGGHLINVKWTVSGKYTVKDGTVSIADAAFWNCRRLTEIVIPSSVVYVGADAFYGCENLR